MLAVMGQGFSGVEGAGGGQQVRVRNWVRVYDNMLGQGQSLFQHKENGLVKRR
jgi:hypothetical protein